MIVVDLDGRVTYWNRGAETTYGRTAKEAIGKPLDMVLPTPDTELRAHRLTEIAAGNPSRAEMDIVRPDGSVIRILCTAVPLRGERRRVVGWIGVASDITERTQMESELRATRERLELLLASGPAVIYSDLPKAGYPSTFMSGNTDRILGISRDELGGTNFLERVHPDDQDRVRAELDLILETGGAVQEYRFLRGDGTYRWLRDESRVVRDHDGSPREIVGYMADITEQHQVSAERRMLASAMDQTTDGIAMADPSGTITYANNAFAEMAGTSRAELVGMPASKLAPGDLAEPFEAAMRAALGGERWSGSVTAHWRQDRSYDFDVSVWPLMIDSTVANLVAVFHDVTHERLLTAALDRHVSERAAISDSVARLRPGRSVQEAAKALVDELVGISGVDHVLVLGFVNGTGVERIASAGSMAEEQVGDLIDGDGLHIRRQTQARRRFLESRVEHRDTHDELTCAWDAAGVKAMRVESLVADGQAVGALVVASSRPDGLEAIGAIGSLVAEYAAVAGPLLVPGLVERRHVSDRASKISAILDAGAFATVAQPIVEIASGLVVGYEALTRFADGTPPDRRFAEAESVGMGLDLEEAAVVRAIEAGQHLPHLPWLSINVSPKLVLDRRRLRRALRRRGGRKILLEITEHAAVDDYEALRRSVKALGSDIEVAVDDAGAGFSSLRHIVELRPKYVKLDIGLVRGVPRDPARQGLIAGMVHFAAETGCVLIAEGIETRAELRTLRRLGVTFGQGYLLGRPASLGVSATD